MWLILCSSTDVSAIWAYHRIKALGFEPLELVSTEMLVYSLYWEHRLSNDAISVNIQLTDGRRISQNKLNGVFNRIVSIPFECLQLVHPGDYEYALQELTAFFLSWLYALPSPVINRPTPQGLSGKSRHISEWIWLASRAGLKTPVYKKDCRNYNF
ncbi:unnamed protein product, partial [marine sediment metagenome]